MEGKTSNHTGPTSMYNLDKDWNQQRGFPGFLRNNPWLAKEIRRKDEANHKQRHEEEDDLQPLVRFATKRNRL